MSPTTNGTKMLLGKVLTCTVALILALIGTVWAITWSSTKSQVEINCIEIMELRLISVEHLAATKRIEKDIEEIKLMLKESEKKR